MAEQSGPKGAAGIQAPPHGSRPDDGSDEVDLDTLRHSTAHVMAQAVVLLWPGARYAIGPPIQDGFYYDFELPGGQRFSDEDLARIEEKMREIIAANQPFVREEMSVEQAKKLFVEQPYKLEILEGIGAADEMGEGVDGGIASVYRNGDSFVDLCRGPHVASTGKLGAFKLLSVAGAYWRGREDAPQLQRIYGTAWPTEEELRNYLARLEQAERRDHRRLGSELDLFHFPPEIGGGLPVFHPKGALLRRLLEDFSVKEHLAAGYQLVWTPHVTKDQLFETSGHLEWYKDAMYPAMEMEGASYHLKPMNCPMHILVYANKGRSYKELPLRLFELGTVYRFERSGVLHGLARVRGLTQDDAHIFCTPDQLAGELGSLIAFVLRTLETFGLGSFEAELSTRPEKYVGELEDWDMATSALVDALEKSGISYRIAPGAGAFYAPKVDVHLKDAIGRLWQVSTIQVDLQLPERFDLRFTGSDNSAHRPFMIHRALYGSVERFMAILIEHYAGAFPLWLAPVQVVVLPVRGDHLEYAQSVASKLSSQGLRVTCGEADEPLGARIRQAKLEKVPCVLVVGQDDLEHGTVGVNWRGANRPQRDVPLSEIAQELEQLSATKALRVPGEES
jgi:threonyl-tRNA synthetase